MSSVSASPFTARVETALHKIGAFTWDACATAVQTGEASTQHPSEQQQLPANPFSSFAFLSSLEDSGCVGRGTGWNPVYLVLEDQSAQIVGVTPTYLKTHSQGEYVFDHGWAEAYARAGGQYYPKLQLSIPFTPAMGPRLLVRGGAGDTQRRTALASALESLRRQTSASSIHVTFTAEPDITALANAGFLERHDLQYHWFNDGYASYDDFLSALASRKRKALKKERREALPPGITVQWLTGSELTEGIWDAFHAFYEDTGARKWGRPYLNRRFFSLIGERMGASIMLAMASRNGRYIAGAINFLGHDTLYGRHWGCLEDHPFLHFELCYHQAIDMAIARGLKCVEAGAQGQHKMARGYVPVITRSMHAIADPGLRQPVARYLENERHQISLLQQEMMLQSPFKKAGEAG